jgi:DNA-binding NarL/FixJ family response regulator
MQITAMIVEDVPALRQHARLMLNRTMGDEVVSIIEAENGAQAIELFNLHKPQFVIMDTVIPGMSGLKIAQHIWSRAVGTRILFWVNAHREFHIKELKRILPEEAVDGYLLQTADDDKFARAIESVLRFNNPFVDPKLRSGNVSFNAGETHLTEVEQETLGDLLLGLTDKAIAKKRNLTVRGVQNRLASLATKLLGRDRSQVESGIEFYNLRVRMIFEALKRGVYTVEDIPELERNLYCWMENTTTPSNSAFSLSR